MVERDFSLDFFPLFMFMYIIQILPIIFPLELIYSQIVFHTKYFVLTFSIDVVSPLSNWRFVKSMACMVHGCMRWRKRPRVLFPLKKTRALHLWPWLPRNTQTVKWPGVWWTQIIFRLYIALPHEDFTIFSQENLPTNRRIWDSIESAVYTGLGQTWGNNIIGIMTQVAFPASDLLWITRAPPTRHAVVAHGIDGKGRIDQ